MNQKPILVPTLDGESSCAAIGTDLSLPCVRYDYCRRCTSGDFHIWIKPDQMQDYLALRLVT